jgi:bifunctional non-homologous end joining protein LigD
MLAGMRASATESTRELRRGNRLVRLSSADRVVFPDGGITKGDLFDYYAAVGSLLVPHLRDRPFTMKRYREGLRGPPFFQKDAPKGMPGWIKTRAYETRPREGGSRLVHFPLVNDELALLWMVQMHCIDMNAWLSRIDHPDRPDAVVFDLDPPDGAFPLAVEVAQLVRGLMEDVGLVAYAKTSGSEGVHVLVPITRRSTFERTHEFARTAASLLERRHPGLVTTEWRKEKRQGVLLDSNQNGWGRTMATVYSVRPKPRAPVSTPLRWDELNEDLDPLALGMAEALARIEKHGDLFRPVLEDPKALAPAFKALKNLES